MTIQEVKAMTIGLTQDKTIAFCKKTRGGKVVPVRPITGEEAAAITATLYAMFRAIHPEQEIMTLPFGKGAALAIKEIKTKQ